MNRPYKILVADDSDVVLKSVQQILQVNAEDKYRVFTAINGLDALTVAYEERPDVILMDIEMPVMTGIEAIKKIRESELIQHIPIIVISSTRRFQQAFSAGANDFLLKPFQTYELLLRIQLNLQLAEKLHEVKVQHELLKSQKHEAIKQRDIILTQKAALLDDLQYARFVQKAILPSEEILKELFKDYFVFNQPKNIVSGDFYWASRKNNLTIVAVGDCTGHGMSGALMTMAGAAFLDEIVLNSTQLSADSILNELRLRVIHLLNQKGNIGEASNGMDIGLCIIDQCNNTLQFAGANNPLYIVRTDNQLEIIKGDRMPIGFYFNTNVPFFKVDMKISKGDMIYLFTDGYADQFGGPCEKKFRYNQFKDLILKAASLPSMTDQHELIESTMNDWINGYEQVDDMLIMGIRF